MWAFYKEVIRKFKDIGAFAPSGPALANAVANALATPFKGTLLELGPGTGAITKGLLKKGISPSQIIAIEYSAAFVEIMKSKYPEIAILQGSAENLSALITPLNKPIHAIVSSLPLRSFSRDKVNILLNEIDKVLVPGGCYIQFTYGKKKNAILERENYTLLESRHVLFNLPPARVDIFVKAV